MYVFAMALAVASTALYHLFQRATPAVAHPLVPFIPLEVSLADTLRQLNWANLALALAVGVVGIELGFLLAYRAGWQINVGDLVANIGATLLLVPLGALLFRERLTPVQLAGGLLCVLGLYLINQR